MPCQVNILWWWNEIEVWSWQAQVRGMSRLQGRGWVGDWGSSGDWDRRGRGYCWAGGSGKGEKTECIWWTGLCLREIGLMCLAKQFCLCPSPGHLPEVSCTGPVQPPSCPPEASCMNFAYVWCHELPLSISCLSACLQATSPNKSVKSSCCLCLGGCNHLLSFFFFIITFVIKPFKCLTMTC